MQSHCSSLDKIMNAVRASESKQPILEITFFWKLKISDFMESEINRLY
jgi:hypothetical protein